jgi:hypothetical protein
LKNKKIKEVAGDDSCMYKKGPDTSRGHLGYPKGSLNRA